MFYDLQNFSVKVDCVVLILTMYIPAGNATTFRLNLLAGL